MKVQIQQWPARGALAFGILAFLGSACGAAKAAVRIDGLVQAGGGPVANSTVTLWAASEGEPKQLAQAKTDGDGQFDLGADETPGPGVSLYLIAKGGAPSVNKGGGDNPTLVFLSVLGRAPPARVVVNEMTTIASVWTNAQFLDGAAIKGPPLSLKIAAGNVPNFVDLQTGGWGGAIQDPLNSSQTPTMANFATLADALAGCATRVTPIACEMLFRGREAAEGRRAERYADGGRGHRAVPLVFAEPAVRVARLVLSGSAGQEPAPGSVHALLEFCAQRLGAAAQIRRRRVPCGRQGDVRQRGQPLGRR